MAMLALIRDRPRFSLARGGAASPRMIYRKIVLTEWWLDFTPDFTCPARGPGSPAGQRGPGGGGPGGGVMSMRRFLTEAGIQP